MRRAEGGPVVDVGVGEAPWTTLELARALRRENPALAVIGVEVDARRAAAAAAHAAGEVEIRVGGFELPLAEPARVVRAMNVLRQYRPEHVAAAHAALARGVQVGGVVVEGSSDKAGHALAALVLRVTRDGPRREALVLHSACVRGFAPLALRDVLPRDLRRGVLPHTALGMLFARWTRVWSELKTADPRHSFRASARALAELDASVEADEALLAQGVVVWRPAEGVPALTDWRPD